VEEISTGVEAAAADMEAVSTAIAGNLDSLTADTASDVVAIKENMAAVGEDLKRALTTLNVGPNPHRDPLPSGADLSPPAFSTAVPVSQTPTVRGGESLRPGPQKSDYDQWGRYKISDPATGAVTGRQRVTTFAKMISDQWGLSQWQQRKLLIGAAENPGITAVAAGRDAKSDKAFLDSIADTLKDASGSKEAAAHGTMMHTHTERLDMGMMDPAEWSGLPRNISRDLTAYQDAIAESGLVAIPEMVERTTMVRSLDVAGTLDRIFRLPNGEHVIGDVKTGQDLSYGWLDIGVQLACYAYGVNENGVFDWSSREWIEAPKVRTDFAVVMHMPAGKGTCTLYRVDLSQGWANCALARSVRDARKARNHAQVLDLSSVEFQEAPAPVLETDPEPLVVQPHSESFGTQADIADLMARMEQARTPAEAGAVWQEAETAGVPDDILQKLADAGAEGLERRGAARSAMSVVRSQQDAAELYAFAAEVWPDDAEFLAELAGIGKTALS